MIKNFRKASSNPLVTLFLCSSLLCFSCRESLEIGIRDSSYTGEDLYRGIFFADGDVSKQLPSINSITRISSLVDANDPILTEIKITQDLIVNQITEADPNFFLNFKAQIQSGDHLTIIEALRTASIKTRTAIENISGLSVEEINAELNVVIKKYNLKDASGKVSTENVKKMLNGLAGKGASENSKEQCLDIILILVIIVVFALAEVVAVVDIVAVAFVLEEIEVVQEKEARANSSLLFDQLVNEIATNLE